jgi:hypothetical protein
MGIPAGWMLVFLQAPGAARLSTVARARASLASVSMILPWGSVATRKQHSQATAPRCSGQRSFGRALVVNAKPVTTSVHAV